MWAISGGGGPSKRRSWEAWLAREGMPAGRSCESPGVARKPEGGPGKAYSSFLRWSGFKVRAPPITTAQAHLQLMVLTFGWSLESILNFWAFKVWEEPLAQRMCRFRVGRRKNTWIWEVLASLRIKHGNFGVSIYLFFSIHFCFLCYVSRKSS